MSTQTYTCGHPGEVPAHMGRGKARLRRLANHFGQKCYPCRILALRARAAKATRVDGTPYTHAEVEGYVARHWSSL